MMETSRRISEYRDRLDKTLASPELTNAETLKSLINNQLQSTSLNNDEEFSEELLQRRTKEVSHFLEMLRSASITNKASAKSHSEWKLKQDTEEFRVMYREGPPGTPFHMLLVEGYVDGPMDACLCVSWESALYKKWWPDYNVPTFKVISSKCVHKIRIGEQISVVRMKVSWPLSAREAVVQYFVFEYFKDDLIVVLLNSVDESENIDKGTHGFTKDNLPEAKDVVRMGVIGGVAMQKVTSGRSYFRTIASVDLKFDFVPPSLINFVSRHLTASGFKLYQKAVGSVFKSDEQFKKVLSDPLYNRIRESLYSSNHQNRESGPIKNENSKKALKTHLLEATKGKTEESNEVSQEVTTLIDPDITKKQTTLCEIEEEISSNCKEEAKTEPLKELPCSTSNNNNVNCKEEAKNDPLEELPCSTSNNNNVKKQVCVSPEVEQALRTLEKVITIVRERGLNPNIASSSSSDEESENVQMKESTEVKDRVSVLASNRELVATLSEETRNSSSSHGSRSKKSNSLREVNHNKVVPASPVENLVVVPDPTVADSVVLLSPKQNGPRRDHEAKETTYEKEEADRSSKNGKKVRRRRKYKMWCFHPGSSSSRRSFG